MRKLTKLEAVYLSCVLAVYTLYCHFNIGSRRRPTKLTGDEIKAGINSPSTRVSEPKNYTVVVQSEMIDVTANSYIVKQTSNDSRTSSIDTAANDDIVKQTSNDSHTSSDEIYDIDDSVEDTEQYRVLFSTLEK